jgi:hypothetical protein
MLLYRRMRAQGDVLHVEDSLIPDYIRKLIETENEDVKVVSRINTVFQPMAEQQQQHTFAHHYDSAGCVGQKTHRITKKETRLAPSRTNQP